MTMDLNSRRELEPMVPVRRPGLHYRIIMHGTSHDPGHRLSLLRFGAQKVSIVSHMGLHDVFQRRHLPMVLLGLFLGT